MTINIRNDRGQTIAFIKVENDHVVEESLKGCYVNDIDGNSDGSCHYRLDINPPQEFIEGLSNEVLLDEIRNRMCQ